MIQMRSLFGAAHFFRCFNSDPSVPRFPAVSLNNHQPRAAAGISCPRRMQDRSAGSDIVHILRLAAILREIPLQILKRDIL